MNLFYFQRNGIQIKEIEAKLAFQIGWNWVRLAQTNKSGEIAHAAASVNNIFDFNLLIKVCLQTYFINITHVYL